MNKYTIDDLIPLCESFNAQHVSMIIESLPKHNMLYMYVTSGTIPFKNLEKLCDAGMLNGIEGAITEKGFQAMQDISTIESTFNLIKNQKSKKFSLFGFGKLKNS